MGTIVIVLVVTSLISFWITQHRINHQAEEAFRDKVRQITGMAEHDPDLVLRAISVRLCRTASSEDIHQVPVVAAWSVAESVCEQETR